MSWVLVKDLRFTHSAVDHLVFFQESSDEHTTIAAMTDSMVVTSKCPEDTVKFKMEIRKYWEITNSGTI